MPERLDGRVEAGTQNASIWLSRFNAAYARKLGAALCLVEIVADIPLRDTFGLKDGGVLALELVLGGVA
jgi:hypothetical protein